MKTRIPQQQPSRPATTGLILPINGSIVFRWEISSAARRRNDVADECCDLLITVGPTGEATLALADSDIVLRTL